MTKTYYYYWCFTCRRAFARETDERQPTCTNAPCTSRYTYRWQTLRLLEQGLPIIPIPGNSYSL
jgi:hypothetical protein